MPVTLTGGMNRMAGSVILSVTYGIEPTSTDDPYIKLSEDAIHYLVEAAVPGAFFVDLIPALQYIPDWTPFAYFKTFTKASWDHTHQVRVPLSRGEGECQFVDMWNLAGNGETKMRCAGKTLVCSSTAGRNATGRGREDV